MTDAAREFLHGPAAERLLAVLGHFCWQGAAVWLLAAAAGPWARSVRARHRLDAAAFLLLCLCPLVTVPLTGPRAEVERTRVLGSVSFTAAPPVPAAKADDKPVRERAAAFAAAPAEPVAGPAAARPAVDWRAWAVGLYLLGAAAGAVRLLVGAAGAVWLRRTLRPAGAAVEARFRDLAARAGVRRRVRVGWSQWAGVPCAAGWVRPAVVLPLAWCGRCPPAVLDAALAHELAHLRAGDVWANLLQRVAEVALFFHPAVWALSARWRASREAARDADAAALVGDPAAVARALEFAAAHAAARPPTPAALLCPQLLSPRRFFPSPRTPEAAPMPLLTRVNALLGGPPARRSRPEPAPAVVALLCLSAVCWAAAARTDPPAGVAAEVGDAAEPGPAAAPPADETSPLLRADPVTPAAVPLAGRPAGSDPVIRAAGFVSPLAAPGQSGVTGVEAFNFNGRWAVLANGREISAWRGRSSAELRDALTAPERAALAAHLRSLPDPEPPQFAALKAFLEGGPDAAPVPTWTPERAGGPNSFDQDEAKRYATALSVRSGGWLICPYWNGNDLHVWHRIEPAELDPGVAAGVFDKVLIAATRGLRYGPEVLAFCEAAGVPNVSFRANAAHPAGWEAGERDFGPGPPRFDLRDERAAGGIRIYEDTGTRLWAWSAVPMGDALAGPERDRPTPTERAELAAALERVAGGEVPDPVARAAATLRGVENASDGAATVPDDPGVYEVTTAAGRWRVAPHDGGWELRRRVRANGDGELPFQSRREAERVFEELVLTRSREGLLVPAYVPAAFGDAVPDASDRVAAAVRVGGAR